MPCVIWLRKCQSLFAVRCSGGKSPTPRVESGTTDCDGVAGHESPFTCDARLPGMLLPSSDFYNTSRIPLPYRFDTVAGTIVVDVRRLVCQFIRGPFALLRTVHLS
eukprot:COSAG01_NODE_3731_length_5755_cov_6.626414_3_plen_106_part_00